MVFYEYYDTKKLKYLSYMPNNDTVLFQFDD